MSAITHHDLREIRRFDLVRHWRNLLTTCADKWLGRNLGLLRGLFGLADYLLSNPREQTLLFDPFRSFDLSIEEIYCYVAVSLGRGIFLRAREAELAELDARSND